MAKIHTFIINTESVNNYGYRVLTSGIDYTQFEKNPVVLLMHNRNTYDSKGDEVIGRATKVYTQGTTLLADIEFDEADEKAQAIAGKVERGFIRMASMGFQAVEWSDNPDHLLSGQTLATITQSKLKEISIVDIGGNDEALRLYDGQGSSFQLSQLEIKHQNMNELKQIALTLGLADTATIIEVQQKINKLKSDNESNAKKLSDLQTELKTTQSSEALELVSKAIELNLIPEALKDSQIKLFETDFPGQKNTFKKLLEEKQKETTQSNTDKNKMLADFVGGMGKGKKELSDTKQSYDYLQKHNPQELKRLKEEDNETYLALVEGYKNGVRHK